MKNKILKIIISCVLVIVAIGGLATAFLLNYNPYVPDVVEITENDDQVQILAKANSSYKGYRFVFSIEKEEKVVESENNIITLAQCLENGVELGQTYKVKFCYLAMAKGNNSQYSKEITWRAEIGLKAPVITLNENDNSLTWTAVDNADFYTICYNQGTLKSTDVTECKFSLSQIPVGERSFYVVAKSNKDYIRSSKASNVIEKTFVRQMQGFSSVNFNKESKILTLKTSEDLKEIVVFVNANGYTCYKFSKNVLADDVKEYVIDISLIYEDDATVGAKPVSIDRYNVYEGGVAYAD